MKKQIMILLCTLTTLFSAVAPVFASNSRLVCHTDISPNKTSPRTHQIDTITIDVMRGPLAIESCGNVLANRSCRASANYGVGKDGRIALYVDEQDRSWCSSNAANDDRAITILVASDSTSPYAISSQALKATVQLVADICKRNGIEKLVWSPNKEDRIQHRNGANMTLHGDFANKPAPFLEEHMKDIAEQVNKMLR